MLVEQLKETYDQNGKFVPATIADPGGTNDGGGNDDTPLPRPAVGGHLEVTCDQNDKLVPTTTADPDGTVDGGGDDDPPLPGPGGDDGVPRRRLGVGIFSDRGPRFSLKRRGARVKPRKQKCHGPLPHAFPHSPARV